MSKRIQIRLDLVTLCICLIAGFLTPSLLGQEEAKSETAAPAADETVSEGPTDGVLSVDRAWDYRPYRVRVWICGDGSPVINANMDKLISGIKRRSELADPSGWELLVAEAPKPWYYRLPNLIESLIIDAPQRANTYANLDGAKGFEELPQIQHDDKLMIVCLASENGLIRCRVREYDLLTRQWSALVKRDVAQIKQLDATVYDMVSTAFMPIARIDRVDEDDIVFMRARAVNVCKRAQLSSEGEWEVNDNSGSPVWVRYDDRFLPVIRKTDRGGQLTGLKPIDFTFLTIEKLAGPDVEASIQSYHRAPLAGRTSKRAQKLALVIRPPEQPTTLRLVSKDDYDYPLEGFEVFSRYVGQPKESPSEPLGMSDWRGLVDIPPSENGMRIILIKRGNRGLKRLPIMPGLFKELVTDLPNDEARLNAEGIINGMRSEILNLVAQRRIYQMQIEGALENRNIEEAETRLDQYKSLSTIDQIQSRMTDDETRLKGETQDKKEMNFITGMFATLRKIISDNVAESKEMELLQRIQEESGMPK